MISTFRNSRLLLVLMMLALVAFTGCGDDDDPANPVDPGGNTGGDGSIVCTVDGTVKTFASNVGAVPDGNGMVIASASLSNFSDVALLTIPDTAGTYAFGVVGGGVLNLTLDGAVYITTGPTGTLTVTQVGDRTAGTFNCTAVNLLDTGDTITITNGTFDVDVATLP